jgi:uncharacterized OB-fold protein
MSVDDTIVANYLGMDLALSAREQENRAYFGFCASGEFRLQCCRQCGLLRYPPGPACPWCSAFEADWVPVEGRGTVHSYMEVQQAIQPAFRAAAPFMVLLVELDNQRGQPTAHEALRVIGNLVDAECRIASSAYSRDVGIGSRVRMIFTPVAPGLALPQWTIDRSASQPARPWRYPEATPDSSEVTGA